MLVESEHLVARGDIAERAGVSDNAVAQWQRRHESFPTPVVHTSAGALWEWPTVEAWLSATGRIPHP